MEPARTSSQRWAHRLAVACALLLLFMIAVGAMVTTTRAGDTNPGWSWRFWEWFTSWWQAQGGRAWEDGHRVIGTIIGFFGIGLAVAFWKAETGRRRWLGVIALGLICLQGLIGGLRVLVVSDADVRDTMLAYTGGGYDVELRRAIKAMIHGVTAQVILAFIACIAVMTSARWRAPWPAQESSTAAGTRRLGSVLAVLGVVQLALGTLVRQTGDHVMLHVSGAVVVTLGVIWLIARTFRYHAQLTPLRRTTTAVALLLVTQVFLGIVPYVMTQGRLESTDPGSLVAVLRTAHVVCGALLLTTLTVNALWLHRLAPAAPGRVHDYAQLTKVRLSGLVMVTVAFGYFIAAPGMPDVFALLATMIGVSLVAAGTSALNQFLERERDARMERTRNRPLPAGRMLPGEALSFGLLTIAAGLVIVGLGVNLLAAALTAATSAIYVLMYTPMKTRSTLNTLVGAVSGAIPPMIGWVAATGKIELGAFLLFAILFVWQLPHFWAIAWRYREDYKRGGMRMLSAEDPDGTIVARQISLWCVTLLLTSLLPVLVWKAGAIYAAGAVVLGLGFLASGVFNQVKRTRESARVVFFVSLVYLPLLLGVLLIDVWRQAQFVA